MRKKKVYLLLFLFLHIKKISAQDTILYMVMYLKIVLLKLQLYLLWINELIF